MPFSQTLFAAHKHNMSGVPPSLLFLPVIHHCPCQWTENQISITIHYRLRKGAWNVLCVLPSIFVQPPQARPSSLRQAALCGGPLTRRCLGSGINHPLRLPEPPCLMCRWTCNCCGRSPLPLGGRAGALCPCECPSPLLRIPPFRDPGRKLGNRCACQRENKVCSRSSWWRWPRPMQ